MQAQRVCPDCGAPIRHVKPGGQCPACLLRIGLSVADGGLAFGLDEVPSAGQSPISNPTSEIHKVRYVGDYELIEEIGRGGMGVVYKARQVSLNRLVALKLVRAGEFADATEVARFRAEAEAAAHLDHPNIVPIYEVGEHEGRHYFSMKLIEGGSLAELSFGSAPAGSHAERETENAKLMATTARAVHYAHQRGLLHRDLKPGNILLDRDGQPHVSDFGLAKRIDTDSAMTQSGTMVGTPSYVAPEQAAGTKQLSTAADVYSLGAILYELLTGRPPFVGVTVMETLQKVMNEEPVPPSKCEVRSAKYEPSKWFAPRPSPLSPDLEVVCLKCLEKDPARRYGTAEALAEDLERWLGHEPIHARPVKPNERIRKWVQRRPAIAALMSLVLVTGFAGLAGIIWQWRAAVTARETAQKATRDKQEQLWASQLQEARSHRMAGGPGQRLKSLEVVARAAAFRPSVELRNEAIAALVLPDLGSNIWWHTGDGSPMPAWFTSGLDYFVPADASGHIAVFRASDQKIEAKFKGLGPETIHAQFSPDDGLLAVRHSNGKVGIWDWRGTQLVFQVETVKWWGTEHRASFDFMPDSREFWVVGTSNQLMRFALPGGQLLPPPRMNVRADALRLGDKGRRLLTTTPLSLLGLHRTVSMWDIGSGQRHGEWAAPPQVTALAWHPDGARFAVGTAVGGVLMGEAGLIDFQPIEGSVKMAADFNRVAFSRDGAWLLAGGSGNFMAIWDTASRQLAFRSRDNGFIQLSKSEDRVAVSRGEAGDYGVRDFAQPDAVRRFFIPRGAHAVSASWHPTEDWLLVGYNSGWVLFDAASSRVLAQHDDPSCQSVQFLPNGKGFLTDGISQPVLWPLEILNGRPQVGNSRRLLPFGAATSERSAVSPDGNWFASAGDGGITVGSLISNAAPRIIPQSKAATYVAFSADGRWLCSGHHHGKSLQMFDARSATLITNLPTGAGYGWFVPGRDEIMAQGATEFSFWRLGTWEQVRRFPRKDSRITGGGAGFWPGGNCALISGTDFQLRLWDSASWEEITTLTLPDGSASWAVAFDPAVRRMATTGSFPYVRIWDFTALRRELAHLGLDWPGEQPSGDFAPRQP